VSNGSGGGPAKGAVIMATERNTSGLIRAVRGDGRTSIAAYHRSGAVSKSRYQPKRIPDQIGLTEHENVAVITVVPAYGPTIASHVRREYMKPCRSEGQHYLAPSIGKLRKSMQEQYTRSAFVLEPGFQDVKSKFVDIAYVTGAYPGRKRNRRKVRTVAACASFCATVLQTAATVGVIINCDVLTLS
jgi:hypothetical protein